MLAMLFLIDFILLALPLVSAELHNGGALTRRDRHIAAARHKGINPPARSTVTSSITVTSSTVGESLTAHSSNSTSTASSRSATKTVTGTTSAKSSTSTSSYKLKDDYSGSSFFNDWDFFSASDPTNGLVNYQTKSDATSKGLAYLGDDGVAVLAVDDSTTLKTGASRDSVRITSKKTYNGGLFIADFAAMPYGCSTWPAWWSVGPGWPAGGEIDVLEGVNIQDVNQMALHTSSGCSMTKTSSKKRSSSLFTGLIENLSCVSSGSDNTGCTIKDTNTQSYGQAFNAAGGGVFAHLWNSDGIKVWHFARSKIPADITSKSPDPSSWGTPVSFYSSSSCDMASHFYDHTLVINTSLCGDWAGATFNHDGCSGSCAATVANPDNFSNAKWKINYISVYDT